MNLIFEILSTEFFLIVIFIIYIKNLIGTM
jgi:hypothetical protein